MKYDDAEILGKTGERMIPDLHAGTLIYAEHLSRYLVVQKLTHNKVVVDIACGAGYGSKLLSEHASKVYGIDVNAATIKYAREKYVGKNIEYLVGDAEKIPLPDNSVDLLVTFETIEHVKNYKKFIKETRRILRPDGICIVSTPNDLEFAEGNHYHLHEFTYMELINLLKEDYKYIDSYFQATWKYVAIGSEPTLTAESLEKVPLLNFSPPHPKQYLYFFLICSNDPIKEKIAPLGILGEHYSDRYLIGQEMQHEQNIFDHKAVIKELETKNQELQASIEVIQRDLTNIVTSKTYQYARKLSVFKNKVLHPGR